MPLSWNEIKHRAIKFGNDWKAETREAAERQTFWNEFFDIFGIKRRTVASFEEPVKKFSGTWGAIDIFWPGKLLGEHKSAGQDLDKAHAQGMGYIRGLQDTGRSKEIPRYLVVSDFQKIALHDLEGDGESITFPVTELHKHIRHFAFIAGYKQHKLDPEDPANIEAAELMAVLHDALLDGGYTGHDLRVFLVRTLFCLFADDTGIFPPDAFKLYLADRTVEDGSDLGPKLDRLFRILNTPEDKRQAGLEEDQRQFPYVNGDLFAEKLEFADFTTAMRNALLKAANFRWERISPAVFGSLFQGVMDKKERRQIGAHYTSEANILKLVRSLFLDGMRAEFEHIRGLKIGKADKLRDLQKRLAALRFLDPACGCGNFLVITYRELRHLELDILKELYGVQSEFSLDDVNKLSLIDVDQMYGIEIEEFPARIAEVALWLTDHQANIELSQTFSQFYLRIPLRKSPHIHVGNALQKDWKEVLPPEQCSYVLGNPPFVGKKEQNEQQKADHDAVWGDVKGTGVLDFVTCWHRLASEYIQNTRIKVAFVSTNSITQGEQVSILWSHLLSRYHLKIHFAHRTFSWESEARGKAHVHCVIIGFAAFDTDVKCLFDYESVAADPTMTVVPNISPYLTAGSDTVVTKRMTPLSDVPEMIFGTKLVDDGHLVLSTEERNDLTQRFPYVASFIRPFTGGEEFLNGRERWCLWLNDAKPQDIRGCPPLMERVERVKQFRLASKKAPTVALATTPSLFGEIRQPDTEYLLFPKVSSERRRYVPLGFVSPEVIANGSSLVVPGASVYHFGVLSSAMQIAWMKSVCGRMKSDFQYSATIVYNNYPWPKDVSEVQKAAVEKAAQTVLDARAKFTTSTLADLYDPTTMPPALVKAHADLDRAVDRCYRKEPFPNDRARVEHLFALYEELAAPLVKYEKPKRKMKDTSTMESAGAAAHHRVPMILREDASPYGGAS
jgi:type I restriction-modification system DNA methylase subunit